MKLLLSLLILSTFFQNTLSAQEWSVLSNIKFNTPSTSYSIDSENNLYIGFGDGRLSRFSSKNEKLPDFSLPNQSAITLVEAQNNRKIFLFQKDIQKISILDRFSTIAQQYFLSEFGIGYAIATCPTPDNGIWITETNPSRLKKIDLLRKNVLLEVQHSLGDSITFMKAIQNLLLVSDENGVHVFDQFGSPVISIEAGKINYVQFLKNEIIASRDSDFLYINPSDGSIRKEVPFPGGSAECFIDLGGKIAVIKKKQVTFYESP
ncbi:MAG: hypothetical protein RIM99_16715 [Cyclobacteriaceae bacterium]